MYGEIEGKDTEAASCVVRRGYWLSCVHARMRRNCSPNRKWSCRLRPNRRRLCRTFVLLVGFRSTLSQALYHTITLPTAQYDTA